jgi:hypothetical protein
MLLFRGRLVGVRWVGGLGHRDFFLIFHLVKYHFGYSLVKPEAVQAVDLRL